MLLHFYLPVFEGLKLALLLVCFQFIFAVVVFHVIKWCFMLSFRLMLPCFGRPSDEAEEEPEPQSQSQLDVHFFSIKTFYYLVFSFYSLSLTLEKLIFKIIKMIIQNDL